MGRALASLAVFLFWGTVHAQAPDVAWPREVKAPDGTVTTVYQRGGGGRR